MNQNYSKTTNEYVANDAAETIANNRVNLPVEREQRKGNYLADSSWSKRVPEHIRNLVFQLRNNTEIRRFTAIGIINYLRQKKMISGDKCYVNFLWDKFSVKANGLTREYLYTEPFFLNAFTASFTSFAASAQIIINTFCHKEMSVGIEKAIDKDEVEAIVEANIEHQSEVLASVNKDDE